MSKTIHAFADILNLVQKVDETHYIEVVGTSAGSDPNNFQEPSPTLERGAFLLVHARDGWDHTCLIFRKQRDGGYLKVADSTRQPAKAWKDFFAVRESRREVQGMFQLRTTARVGGLRW